MHVCVCARACACMCVLHLCVSVCACMCVCVCVCVCMCAAFCQNLLQDEVLRWANFSLVVLDEAHHCTKNHPYNKLLSEHHLSLPPERRPKILGLTASPAGRRTKEETLHMLKDLLKNLGISCLSFFPLLPLSPSLTSVFLFIYLFYFLSLPTPSLISVFLFFLFSPQPSLCFTTCVFMEKILICVDSYKCFKPDGKPNSQSVSPLLIDWRDFE